MRVFRNIKGASMVNILPTTKYIAVNLKMDMMIPLDQQHLSSCTQVNTNQLLLCNLDLPIYGIKTATKMCEADIINNRGISTCHKEVSSCSDELKKLHSKGAWLFTCCEECTVRIFCPAGITSQTLQNTGIISFWLFFHWHSLRYLRCWEDNFLNIWSNGLPICFKIIQTPIDSVFRQIFDGWFASTGVPSASRLPQPADITWIGLGWPEGCHVA